jgi:hypothetical protein
MGWPKSWPSRSFRVATVLLGTKCRLCRATIESHERHAELRVKWELGTALRPRVCFTCLDVLRRGELFREGAE